VHRGDRVVTASGGLDVVAIPPGLAVGRVDRVGFNDDRSEKTLVIEPAADLHALTYVTVLLCDDDCS
jgi:cell shape-determining protein MreC